MNVIVNNDVLEKLGEVLKVANKTAVRFEVSGFG
jgi:hypothetical protein